MNETQYTKKVSDLLKRRGAYFEKIWGGGMQSAGIPDILVCYKGVFIGMELKVGNNKPSELQKVKVDFIRKAGGVGAILWDNLEPVNFILDVVDNVILGKLPWSYLVHVGAQYNVRDDSKVIADET